MHEKYASIFMYHIIKINYNILYQNLTYQMSKNHDNLAVIRY